MIDIVQLVYVSRTARGLDEADVQQMLITSRRNNWRVGVSGCLLFTGTGFAQAIEGRPDAVKHLFERIAVDTRHTDIRVALHAPISRRAFPNWSMGSVFDLQLGTDLEALLDMPVVPPTMIGRLTDRMAADSFLGTS